MTEAGKAKALLRRFGALLLWTIGILESAHGYALDTREIFKIAESSVVVVMAADTKGEKNSLGSGVLIAPLDVVTSCKVVESGADILVTQGSALRKARLQFQDKERDLCQLHIDDPLPVGKPAAVAASPGALESGQDVFVVSSPRGLERTINRTMVSGLRETAGTSGRLIQIDLQLSGGSIGGGVFDQDARLVGLVTPQFRQGENFTYVIPVDWIAQLAQRNPDRLLAAAAPAATNATTPATPAELPAWMPRVGDRWKYKLTYGKQDAGKVNVEIIAVRQATATERITYDRSKGFVKERTVDVGFHPQKFLPLAALPGGYQLVELSPYINPDFEFKSGQNWKDVPGEFAPQGGSNSHTELSTVSITTRETVRVPAGEFKTWKIESVSENFYHGNHFFVAKCTFWYAQEIKRAVKMMLFYKSPADNYSSIQTFELDSFEQGK